MTSIGIAQILVYFLILLVLTKPLGRYMYRVFEGEKTFLHRFLYPLEQLIYHLGGVREGEEQSWVQYAGSVISLSLFSFLAVYLLQRWQGHLPFNPAHFSTSQAPQSATAMTPDLAFNTAVSFMTNTNWQAYSYSHSSASCHCSRVPLQSNSPVCSHWPPEFMLNAPNMNWCIRGYCCTFIP